jgi:hypothetical protein
VLILDRLQGRDGLLCALQDETKTPHAQNVAQCQRTFVDSCPVHERPVNRSQVTYQELPVNLVESAMPTAHGVVIQSRMNHDAVPTGQAKAMTVLLDQLSLRSSSRISQASRTYWGQFAEKR